MTPLPSEPTGTLAETVDSVPSRLKMAVHGFRQAPIAFRFGGILVIAFIAVAFTSIWWTPHDPIAIAVEKRLAPPGWPHLLGTDALGRDVLSQLMEGARNSLLIGGLATIAAMVPGVAVGLLAASAARNKRLLLSRAADVGVALPGILIALVLATAIGPSNLTSVLAIIAWFTPVVVRLTIGPARQVLALPFVEAARAYGRGRSFIALRHVLPNIGPLLIVQASAMFAAAILIEAALSYLGVGAPRPTPSWGRMLNESQSLIEIAPTLVAFPGLAIMGAVLGFNLLGDGLRVLLDPRQEAHTVAV